MSSQSPSKKRLVILGGSYGGVSTAHFLLKNVIPTLADSGSYEVVLVSASSQAMCRQACPRAMISDEFFPQEKLFVDISKMFSKYPKDNFEFMHGKATAVDHTERVVTVTFQSSGKEEMIHYHALIIATGASTPSPALGLNNDVEQLRDSWADIRKVLPTAKSVVIAGGGPAGVETAGELGEYLNGAPGWIGSRSSFKVDIKIVTSGSRILPALRSELAQVAEKHLAKLGVTVIKNARVKTVEPPHAGEDKSDKIAVPTAVALDNGQILKADLYIPATGTTPNTGFLDQTLLATDGRVETNTSTLRVEKAGMRVYAIGDASSFARPTVHSIFQAVPVLCANIKRDLLLMTGAKEAEIEQDSIFKEDTREAQLVPIGRSKGVGAVMGYKLPSFVVWLVKGRDYFLWTTGKLWSGEQWTK